MRLPEQPAAVQETARGMLNFHSHCVIICSADFQVSESVHYLYQKISPGDSVLSGWKKESPIEKVNKI